MQATMMNLYLTLIVVLATDIQYSSQQTKSSLVDNLPGVPTSLPGLGCYGCSGEGSPNDKDGVKDFGFFSKEDLEPKRQKVVKGLAHAVLSLLRGFVPPMMPTIANVLLLATPIIQMVLFALDINICFPKEPIECVLSQVIAFLNQKVLPKINAPPLAICTGTTHDVFKSIPGFDKLPTNLFDQVKPPSPIDKGLPKSPPYAPPVAPPK